MENALKIGLVGTVITIVLATFVAQTINTGGSGENLSGIIKLLLGLLPVGTAIGTFIAVFKFK